MVNLPLKLVESAYRSIVYFNEFGYDNIVLSIKSSDVVTTIDANRLFREKYSSILHLGVTEGSGAWRDSPLAIRLKS